jgi:adenosine deaminase
MDAKLQKFIEGMPKIELHLHIEGTMEPEMLMQLAQRNGIELPYKDIEELKAAYKRGSAYENLQEFLDLYYQGMNVLCTEEDFYDLTKAYLKQVASENVTHTEIFFDPQGHTMDRGKDKDGNPYPTVSFETAINGITRALDEAKTEGLEVQVDGRTEKRKVTSKLIMSFLRHMSEEDGFKVLEQAKPHMDKIDGFGLDSSEWGREPALFERLYETLRKDYPEKKLLAHAGEEGPAAYVEQALDVLKIDRIDHGNHVLDDEQLTSRVASQGQGMTVCPLSNLKLSHKVKGARFGHDEEVVMTDLGQHRIKDMLAKNLKASVHSDDPAFFDGYMNANYIQLARAQDLKQEDIVQLAQNAIDTSFLSPAEKAEKTTELADYVTRFNAAQRFVNPEAGQVRKFG